MINIHNIETQPFTLPEFSGKNLDISMLRLDKIHPVISGNKWFKLKYYLTEALEKKHDTILTFGGAWSNHIIATAYISKLYGLRSIGVIRGEKPLQYSQTLLAAEEYGMTLEFIDRGTYSRKNEASFITALSEKFGETLIVPEGGAGPLGIRGSKEILSSSDAINYTHIICCIGTGTMFTGLVNSSAIHQEVIGLSVLKGVNYIPDQFIENPQKLKFFKIIDGYHFGGYAKKTVELIHFMNYFYQHTGIPTDFVYTGKLLFGCSDMVMKDYFPKGSRILIIHSGGLQGNESLSEGILSF